ncbi:hypothetical protein AGROH133_12696 [Agrobacterium tumefaciens]|nr:hypothetical protein AGROH133_12696 [Agrobacterium tumefaciens]
MPVRILSPFQRFLNAALTRAAQPPEEIISAALPVVKTLDTPPMSI